jgi:hypothetical protein
MLVCVYANVKDHSLPRVFCCDVYIYVYVYVYMHVLHTITYNNSNIYTKTCTYTYIYIYIYIYIYAHNICMQVYMHSRVKIRHTAIDTYSDFHNDCLFLAQEKTILVRNAENKDRSSALWLRNLNLSFFYEEKKRQSLWKSEYIPS